MMRLVGVQVVPANQEPEHNDEDFGDPIPLNEAAIIEQKRHVEKVDSLLKSLLAAQKMQQVAQHLLDQEQERWAAAMREAMPELRHQEEFLIDGQTHYRLPKPKGPQPPEWVKDILAGMDDK